MRTVYLGTSEFAAAVLRTAGGVRAPPVAGRHPARPPARPRPQAAPPPVADAARELGHRARPAGVGQRRERARDDRRGAPEVVCVCAFGALITEPLLSRWEMLNVHPSLLPRWRGAAPIERAIMAGDELPASRSCASGGARRRPGVLRRRPSRSGRGDTYGTLAARLEELGGRAARACARRAAAVHRAGRGAGHVRPQDQPARTAS